MDAQERSLLDVGFSLVSNPGEFRAQVGPKDKIVALLAASTTNSIFLSRADRAVLLDGISDFGIPSIEAKIAPSLESTKDPRKMSKAEKRESVEKMIRNGDSSPVIAERFGRDGRWVGCIKRAMKEGAAKKKSSSLPPIEAERDSRGRMIWTPVLLEMVKGCPVNELDNLADRLKISGKALRSARYQTA